MGAKMACVLFVKEIFSPLFGTRNYKQGRRNIKKFTCDFELSVKQNTNNQNTFLKQDSQSTVLKVDYDKAY